MAKNDKATKNESAVDNAITGEVVAAAEQTTAVATAKDRPKFTLKRRVTLELFKTIPSVENFYKIESAIVLGKPIKENVAPGAKKKDPAYLMNVTDLQTGVLGQIIVGSVLRSTLEEEYPDETYVGKQFVIKMRKIAGKDYNGYDIAEIEIE